MESSPPQQKSDSPKKPIFVGKVETTGNSWTDFQEAVKRLHWSDFGHVGEMPCTRNSLLTGIASGVGVGVIRVMSARPFVAYNWALGTFVVISTGSWMLCKKAKRDEIRRLQHTVERIPTRFIKRDVDSKQ